MICKWCKAYEEKLKILDSILKKKWFGEEKTDLNDTDIQEFKDRIIRKLDF
jgi:hypothetical protein